MSLQMLVSLVVKLRRIGVTISPQIERRRQQRKHEARRDHLLGLIAKSKLELKKVREELKVLRPQRRKTSG